MIKKISKKVIVPSGALTIKESQVKWYRPYKKKPTIGDVVLVQVKRLGQHQTLENKFGRIHQIHHGTNFVGVFGNRYAPDYYESKIPKDITNTVDMVARSGVLGKVHIKNSFVADPTKVEVLGYVCTKEGKILNTKNFPLIVPKHTQKNKKRSKMILVCGTAMNSGKSTAAAAACWALSNLGKNVRGAKITGTASLKDILHMNDAGASHYSDFSYLGFPSTYLLSNKDVLQIFNNLDLKYANNPKNYWVVELADGINQRETSMLLQHPEVRSRIHKLIFCASGAFDSIGGIDILKKKFDLVPDAISGLCTSSPLHIQEIQKFTDIPIFNNTNVNAASLGKLML
jgi:hypothetical protein